ncbi:LysR family transcriptional regulator [Pseudomonas agarici]|uniref:LysR family transcriptional regulator n=1 Tax=Pseudomonas agarici TaxID=46677 RepID=A0A0X1T3Q0_PSEAA|nr:LysR family transcriptional regulator [Pseudomonas agarici]AMB86705.1 LysR family transcriptional regulator [Pseudomonas agarici]NWB93972.1 LysR family transcriptional regulator [Pseudomonas agarici]NWC11406.1 LysR family transcriptional regulator [Pseudomonas agarici]SEL70516.1 DNA-binding transcriptional regulator, LysR family [Pseudomonas agarici]
MLSFKQLEAVFWGARLGTFAAAAERLHTSESAISKRVSELEIFLGKALFDRSKRRVKLTHDGLEFVEQAEEMLRNRDRLLARMGKESAQVKRFRVGVTELIALTWLPQLVQAFRERYPDISFEPEIDLSINLVEKLQAGQVDLVIVPKVFSADRVVAVPLQEMRLSWMCRPDLIDNQGERLSFDELAQYPILTQTGRSGVDVVYDAWFKEKTARIRKVYAGNSLISLATLTILGFGVSYLPSLYFSDLARKNLLREITLDEPSPLIQYNAVYLGEDSIAGFSAQIAQLCILHCDFSKPSFDPMGLSQ